MDTVTTFCFGMFCGILLALVIAIGVNHYLNRTETKTETIVDGIIEDDGLTAEEKFDRACADIIDPDMEYIDSIIEICKEAEFFES